MKNTATLERTIELAQSRKNAAYDTVVPMEGLKVCEDRRAIVIPAHDSEPVSLTERSIGQLANKLQINVNTFRDLYDTNRGILQQYIDHRLAERPELADEHLFRMHRTANGMHMRAVLSKRYQIIDSVDMLQALQAVMGDNLTVDGAGLTSVGCAVRVIDPSLSGQVSNDTEGSGQHRGGVEVRTNEVGQGYAEIVGFILRLVCMNGLVSLQRESVWRRKHVRGTWSQTALEEQMKGAIECGLSQETFADQLGMLNAATSSQLNFDSLDDFEARMLKAGLQTTEVQALMRTHDNPTRFNVAQGITQHAHNVPFERGLFLEGFAADLVAGRVNP